MPTVVGVRLKPAGKVLSFDAAGTQTEIGDVVIVSTERGEEMGEIARASEEIEPEQIERKLKPVLRVATPHDMQIADDLAEREVEAMKRYRELVAEHGLDMKPVAVEALFDGRKMVFYFTAEERVDFRNLVKDLARDFKARIDMRQIGVRDEARMLGGIGHCGQQLCCRRYMDDFEPVSIRMAKAQDLPLNPLKISGLCGRLMCCLRYEYEAYKDFKSRAPKMGAMIETPGSSAKVISLDAPRETVTLYVDSGRVTIPLASMDTEGCPGPRPCRVSAEVLDEARGVSGSGLLDGVGDDSRPKGKSRRSSGRSSGGGSPKRSGGGKGDGKGGSKGGSKSDDKGSSSSSRRKRGRRGRRGGKGRSGSGSQQQGDAKGQSQKGQGQGQKQGQKKQPQGQKQGQKKQGQQGQSGQQGGAKSQQGQPSSSGRRRRRRRPRSDGGSQPRSDG